jgi:acyl carrier protein
MSDGAAINEALTAIFRDVFLREDMVLSPEMSAATVEGWDSFKQIEIMISVEERFGILLNTREIDSLRCVGDLMALVKAKAA